MLADLRGEPAPAAGAVVSTLNIIKAKLVQDI